MNDQVRKLALLGLTNAEMAAFFGVSERTFYNWQSENPAFLQSVADGKVIADANVAESLYKRAIGEHVQIEKIVKNRETGETSVIKIMTYIPGEAPAAMNWLKNRRGRDWREKQEIEHTGEVIHKIERVIVRPDPTDS